MDTKPLRKTAMDDVIDMVRLWRVGRLPDTVLVIKVPLEKCVYDNFRIARDPLFDSPARTARDSSRCEIVENITIRRFIDSHGQTWYAGYGSRTKTLVIGE